jgi:para-aminobenzoate synthetase component I
VKLLPAGSVSGAPKPKTLEIIRNVEGGNRGYYTGVFGVFDGNTLDSGVMIRFIEQENGKLYYRSGGGITTQSVVSSEYQEVIDKVYVPLT